MAQTVATNFRKRIDLTKNSNRSSMRIIEKIWKQIDRIVKYCQMPKMNLINSSPYILDILPELNELLRNIINNYDDRLHILNEIEYFQIFLDNLHEECTKIIECFKRAGRQMYDEQSTYRKYLIKFSLYFSHNLAELKSLFIDGIYQGERFRLTKQEAAEFWKINFNERTIIPWEEFKDKLNRVHPIQSSNEATALQNTIDLTNNNHVSIFEFDVFTRLFHPWSSLLTNWKLLSVTHPGFMAFMTYDEVKAILTNYIDKPGSYVFRLSCTRLGQWAIGYVTTQKTILQTIPQTKSLIQSLIDGERERYYVYPNGKNIHIDLSSALRPTESNRISVSEEQYAIYCDIGTSFELCKICSVNNKNCKIQPCGHLLCQNCLIAWQNKNTSKQPPLCPFCRAEIKGFESIIIDPFDKKETNSNESDDISSIPPPIPPRPISMRLSTKSSIPQCFPPPLHNNDVLLLPQRCSSNDGLPSDIYLTPIDEFRSIDDIRSRLISENNFDEIRVNAALILTQGLALLKQYEMAKLFLIQVKNEQKQNSSSNDI